MKFNLIESVLSEDLDSSYTYYQSKIDRNTFDKLIAFDPTFKVENDKLGTYGKWILDRFIKKDITEKDFGHIKDALNRFDDNKKFLANKDINAYKNLQEIDDILNQTDVSLTHRQEVRQNQKDRHNADIEKDLIFNGSEWKVYTPSSYANSCKLGEGSSWCTASTESDNYYTSYTHQGPLYILINKSNPEEKYQFHIESGSYMDADDYSINVFDFLEGNKELQPLFSNKVFGPYLKSLGIEEGASDSTPIEIKCDMFYVLDYYGKNSSRNDISQEAVKDILNEDPFFYDFSYISDDETKQALEYYSNDILKDSFIKQQMERLDITLDELISIMNDDEIEIDNSSIDIDDLKFELNQATRYANENGSLSEAYDDVTSAFDDTVSYLIVNAKIVSLDSNEIRIKTDVLGVKQFISQFNEEHDYVTWTDDSVVDMVEQALGEHLEIIEPRYGWNGFDKETFLGALGDALSNI